MKIQDDEIADFTWLWLSYATRPSTYLILGTWHPSRACTQTANRCGEDAEESYSDSEGWRVNVNSVRKGVTQMTRVTSMRRGVTAAAEAGSCLRLSVTLSSRG